MKTTYKRGLALLGTGVLIWLLIGAVRYSAPRAGKVPIIINHNGLPTLHGMSLGKGATRELAFRMRHWAGFRTTLIGSGGTVDAESETNLVQTLHAAIKTGLIPARKVAEPSPYE